jgi:glycosyltransferase involved in cell wall biosynthesis
VNILFVCNGSIDNKKFKSATWIEGLVTELKNINTINLAIAFSSINNDKIENINDEGISFYRYPLKFQDVTKYDKNTETYLQEIITKVKPDIVHVFGTEYPFALATANVCEKLGIIDKMVISIQGLISKIQKHYHCGVPFKIVNRFSVRDLLRWDNIKIQEKKFAQRGKNEIAALQKSKHVIGRTTFDKAVTLQINPQVKYHFCNETLRSSFYIKSWDYENCEKFTIFLSQSYYPVKGFHYMLEAMPIILKKYPKAHIYTIGEDLIKTLNLRKWLKEGTYQKYLRRLIKEYHLENNITFLGRHSAEQMRDRYLKSNVFVSPSTIENSPNSLGEAMILGVPSVASDVGGVSDMLTHKEDGYIYQSDAPYMLAHYVCELFENPDLALNFSEKAKKHASITHDRKENTKTLLEIYNVIDITRRK